MILKPQQKYNTSYKTDVTKMSRRGKEAKQQYDKFKNQW